MTVKQKANYFKQHGIRFMVNFQNTEIIIEDLWTKRDYKTNKMETGSNLIDATDWNFRQVRDFLGY